MTLVLDDDLFDAQLVRALAYTRSGGAEIGECVGTARRITRIDGELWYREWLATAERAEQAAEASTAAGDRNGARDALLRSGPERRSPRPHRTFVCRTVGDDISADAGTLAGALTCRTEFVEFGHGDDVTGHCEMTGRAVFHQRLYCWLDDVLNARRST